jgi:hypothetical protein
VEAQSSFATSVYLPGTVANTELNAPIIIIIIIIIIINNKNQFMRYLTTAAAAGGDGPIAHSYD